MDSGLVPVFSYGYLARRYHQYLLSPPRRRVAAKEIPVKIAVVAAMLAVAVTATLMWGTATPA